jgi:mannose-6-phosphate isomerase
VGREPAIPYQAPSRPIVMPPNVIDHYYRGGSHIARLRGIDLPSPRRPEEWLAATVHRADDPLVGLSATADGVLLRDRIAADPIGWLGTSADGAGAGGDTGILVKLLDAGQRLPVHVHPTRPFARSHLHCGYGKTEAWYILHTSGDDPAVWVGFAADVEPDELARRVEAQDSAWMLAHLNKIPVRAGDGVVVPSGTPHATGAGVFLVEVQEPTDFSILLEWSVTTSTRAESHLGLGMGIALGAVNHRATGPGVLAELVQHNDTRARSELPQRGLPAAADEFFRLDVLAPPDGGSTRVSAGFGVAVVIDGAGVMAPQDMSSRAGELEVDRGQVLAIPAGYGPWRVSGPVQVVLCRPAIGWPGNVVRPAARAGKAEHTAVDGGG